MKKTISLLVACSWSLEPFRPQNVVGKVFNGRKNTGEKAACLAPKTDFLKRPSATQRHPKNNKKRRLSWSVVSVATMAISAFALQGSPQAQHQEPSMESNNFDLPSPHLGSEIPKGQGGLAWRLSKSRFNERVIAEMDELNIPGLANGVFLYGETCIMGFGKADLDSN